MPLVFRDLVAVAGLIHDLGKPRQRCGVSGSHAEIGAALVDEFANLFPYEWLDDLRDVAGNHHGPSRKEIEKLVKIGDWLASGERVTLEGLERIDPADAALVPVTSRVELLSDRPEATWGYALRPLGLDEEAIFPTAGMRLGPFAYAAHWAAFAEEARRMPPIRSRHQIGTLMALLRKYASCIPSATPWEEDEEHRTLPDVSLYDHLKVTGAIATVLTAVLPDDLDALLQRKQGAWDRPVCLAVRGDLSGIQDFVYRITEAGAEGKGTAKRLRGRSLFLTLLNEAIAYALLRELELPECNLLYCGGGRLDVLAPLGTESAIESFSSRLEHWLLAEFGGTLGFQIVSRPVSGADFATYERVFEALDTLLADSKRRKFSRLLRTVGPGLVPVYHLCRSCQLTPLGEPGTCDLCEAHLRAGRDATTADYLLWVEGDCLPGTFEPTFRWQEPVGASVTLLGQAELRGALQAVARLGAAARVFRLNDTRFRETGETFEVQQVAWGFRFLANAVPRGDDGTVQEFGELAAQARGAPYLGVVKADMDRLGLVFRRGLSPASISRLSSLSSQLDLFFCGWLNRVCERVSRQREAASSNVLYTMYAGGDDVFVLGPWDAAIRFATALEEDFRRFGCQNCNLTLSAGLVFVKPQFPVARFAELVGQELEHAKRDRNALRLFGETLAWRDADLGVARLLRFAEGLVAAIEGHKVPRTLVHDLMRLHNQHFRADGSQDLGWVYKALYTIARRVSPEVVRELDLFRSVAEAMPRLRVPASYVVLATRRG